MVVVVCCLLFAVACYVLLHGVVLVVCGWFSVCVVVFVARSLLFVVCCLLFVGGRYLLLVSGCLSFVL